MGVPGWSTQYRIQWRVCIWVRNPWVWKVFGSYGNICRIRDNRLHLLSFTSSAIDNNHQSVYIYSTVIQCLPTIFSGVLVTRAHCGILSLPHSRVKRMTDMQEYPISSLSDTLSSYEYVEDFLFSFVRVGGGDPQGGRSEGGGQTSCIRQYSDWFGTMTTAFWKFHTVHTQPQLIELQYCNCDQCQ